MVVAIIFFTICALAAAGLFAFGIYKSVSFVKTPIIQNESYPRFFKNQIMLGIGFTVAFTAMLVWIYPWNGITPKIYESIQGILGGAIFAASLFTSINLFIVYYYRQSIPDTIKKHIFRIMMLFFTITVLSIFVCTNGYADYMNKTEPLPNGISFTQGLVRPGDEAFITFYALCILGGAIFVYFLCNHKMKLEYGDDNIFESTFLVAFPAGIVGARLFYVIGNFNVPKEKGGFGGVFDGNVFNLRQGGLTILGGAIMGIAVGALWFILRKKKYNIWVAVDIALPTILIAQAIGRFGNFFNIEVHGAQVAETGWEWLPRIIFNNAHFSSANGVAETGKLYVPLFLIEALVNLFGYALLAHVFGIKLRKYTELGDIGFGYIIWYGLTRMFLEPLRDSSFNMGNNGYWSWVWSMIFVIVGCALILGNHIIRYYLKKKKGLPINNLNEKRSMVNALIISVAIVTLVAMGALLMSQGTYVESIAYSKYNLGLMLIILGASLGMIEGVCIFNIAIAKKQAGKTNEQI